MILLTDKVGCWLDFQDIARVFSGYGLFHRVEIQSRKSERYIRFLTSYDEFHWKRLLEAQAAIPPEAHRWGRRGPAGIQDDLRFLARFTSSNEFI